VTETYSSLVANLQLVFDQTGEETKNSVVCILITKDIGTFCFPGLSTVFVRAFTLLSVFSRFSNQFLFALEVRKIGIPL